MKKYFIVLILFSFLLGNNVYTTWFPAEKSCPFCHQKSEYMVIGSWGTYIYYWPSKYQYIFWPLTDEQSVYCCPKCYYAAFMWDFDTIPPDKTEPLKSFLSTIEKKNVSKYLDIDIIRRLEIAEGVYHILGRDLEFWCRFYRVMGYHYAKHHDKDNARKARLKAIEIAHQMLADIAYKGQEKEIYYVLAAMHYFIEQKDSTIFYLRKAETIEYVNKQLSKKESKNVNDYLNYLINDYRKFMKKKNL